MSSKRFAIPLTLLLAIILLPGGNLSSSGADARPGPTGHVLFIENAGQFDPAARFQVWGGPGVVWLTEDALWLSQVEGSGSKVQGWKVGESDLQPLRQAQGRLFDRLRASSATFQPATSQRVNVRLSFLGANPHPVLEPFDRLDTHVSYFIGNDPAQWRPDVPVWGGVRYVDLYPGVDLVVGAGLAPALADGRPQDGQPQGHVFQLIIYVLAPRPHLRCA